MARWIIKHVVPALAAIMVGVTFLPGVGFADPKNSADEKPIFGCPDFSQKIQDCEAYVCEITLAGVPTAMQIQSRKNGRCVVATTIGILKRTLPKNAPNFSGRTVRTPVTTICEYDQVGVNQLSARFEAMESGRYNFSSKDMHAGEYNCRTATEGQIFSTPRDAKNPEVSKPAKGKKKTSVSTQNQPKI